MKVFWKMEETLMMDIAFTVIVFGDCFPSKMTSTSWMCRIWARSFHWLFLKLDFCIAGNTGFPDNFVTGLVVHD